jgi:RimJ/RimL family protein N-acetyltransferase
VTASPSSLTLEPVAADADVTALVEKLLPAFRGDDAGAREVLTQTVDLLTRDPRPSPWGSYLALDAGSPVGLCAFKAAPDPRGAVEIAYMTFPAFEGRGHATAMAAALTEIAFDAGAPLVIAHTLPLENPSNRALRRSGFAYAGEAVDPEDGLVWRWERRCGP